MIVTACGFLNNSCDKWYRRVLRHDERRQLFNHDGAAPHPGPNQLGRGRSQQRNRPAEGGLLGHPSGRDRWQETSNCYRRRRRQRPGRGHQHQEPPEASQQGARVGASLPGRSAVADTEGADLLRGATPERTQSHPAAAAREG
uniref:(northern house mosquito) hypothetical protein n=1 Tax=Culex pipiens TaxID=7175 RepID=A0A8D8MQR4_CULPI